MKYFGTSFDNMGHQLWDLDKGFRTSCDLSSLPFEPEAFPIGKNLENGTVQFFLYKNYSIFVIVGSIRDNRPGSKTIFIENELLSFDEMLKRILSDTEAYDIITRLPFPVKFK